MLLTKGLNTTTIITITMATKITNTEFLRLKKVMIKSKKEIEHKLKQIEDNNPIIITDDHNKVLHGSPKHHRVADYIIQLLKKEDLNYKVEVGIYLKNIKKQYRIDILTFGNKRQIAIECGQTHKTKIKHLKKYFDVIHLSYNDFKTLVLAKKIENNIMEVIKK